MFSVAIGKHCDRAGGWRGGCTDSLTSVALVPGGGGCGACGHIGVLRVREQHRMRPDLVVGSSAGSLVGALGATLPLARARPAEQDLRA